MDRADILALPGAAWQAEYLENTSHRRLVVEFYDREHVSLRRYVSFLGIDDETSREIVQETFLKLHQHLLKGGEQHNLRAWLYRVAHNLARNAQGAFSASKTDQLPDLTAGANFAGTVLSAEDEMLAAERAALLRKAVERLSSSQRECLVLRAQGLKYREIASVLKLSVSTVAENVQRGLEKLKELL